MATITQTRSRCKDSAGIRSRRVLEITGPSSYVAGGDPVSASAVFLGKIEYFPPIAAVNAGGTTLRIAFYDYTNEKLVWFEPTTGVEVAAATDLSGYKQVIEVIGK